MTYLLDTNVVSEWARPRPEATVVRWLADVDEDQVFISVVTLAELEKGIRLLSESAKRRRLEEWVQTDLQERFGSRMIDITPDIAREWGRVTADRQTIGRPISTLDAFLAATARLGAHTLVTRNDRDFADTGVQLLNPWAH